MSLAPALSQQDFSGGMFRMAPHLIPANGAWQLQDMLLAEDGSAFARGGTVLASTGDVGTGGVRMLFDGVLAGGQRTVFATATGFATIAVDGRSPQPVGAPGVPGPTRPVVVDGILFAGSSAYAGSRLSAPYSTGTLQVTNGSTVVVGSGTLWVGNVDPGTIIVAAGRLYAVASVEDNTHLTLARPFSGESATSVAYTAARVAAVPAGYNPGGTWAVAGNRLISLKGGRIAMSALFDSSSWDPTEEWLLPEGVECLGAQAIRDTLLVFTTGGVFQLTNLALNLTDDNGNVQQSLQPINQDMILLSDAALTTWENAVLVPSADGVWIMGPGDASSAPAGAKLLTRSIAPLWAEFVGKGYQLGQAAVYAGHYLLPVLDAGGTPVTMLVCRLDRPVNIRGIGQVWPWTNWSGAAASVRALTVRVQSSSSRLPTLLGGHSVTGRLLQYAPFTTSGPRVDHDGSPVAFDIITRDYATGELGTVKKVRVRYELVDSAGTPAFTLAWASEMRAQAAGARWGEFNWGEATWGDASGDSWQTLSGAAGTSFGDAPKAWMVAKRVRYVRFRMRAATPAERMVLRQVDVFVRPSGRI